MTAYATVLDKHGYSAEAGCLYYQAYKHPQGRVNPSFLRNYALYLQKAGRIDLASFVMDRKDVEELALAGEKENYRHSFQKWKYRIISARTKLGHYLNAFRLIKHLGADP